MNTASLIIQALVAVGTIAVAVLAIWGDWIRAKLVPPKLTIRPHNLRGCLTEFSRRDPGIVGKRVIYYHVKVVNCRPWSPARNCRVLLRAILVKAPNEEFVPLPMVIPHQFVWAPAQLTPSTVTLSKEGIVDFGRLIEGAESFEPVLYFYANDFGGRVKKGGAIRYVLEAVADGFVASHQQIFEVAWDGNWSENLDEMARSLTIRVVSK